MEEERVGFQVRTLSNLIHRKINEIVVEEEETLTAHQAWVLKLLADREDCEVVQRDIEKIFSIRRSTASHMLKLMENNGYIQRIGVPQDARMKRLVLTEKGKDAYRRMAERLRRFEAMLRAGMTGEEVKEFLHMIERFQQNIQ